MSSYETPVLIQARVPNRIVLVSTDVLHSLGIPRIGVKLDTTPGRISACLVESKVLGIFLGSCYELCGRGHRAIPVHLLVIS